MCQILKQLFLWKNYLSSNVELLSHQNTRCRVYFSYYLTWMKCNWEAFESSNVLAAHIEKLPFIHTSHWKPPVNTLMEWMRTVTQQHDPKCCFMNLWKSAVMLLRFHFFSPPPPLTCFTYALTPLRRVQGGGPRGPDITLQLCAGLCSDLLNMELCAAMCPQEHSWMWHTSQLGPVEMKK